MKKLNRRQWLRLSGLGTAAVLGGISADAAPATSLPNAPANLADKLIRLSSNENPYGPSPRVRDAMINAFDNVCRYPFMFSGELTNMLAEKHGVRPEQILLTAGSTEGLKVTGLTYGLHGREIIAANPVFKALTSYAEQFGAYIHRVPLTKDLQHDLPAMAQRITHNTSLVFLCNPNNPTGTLLGAQQLRDFCKTVEERAVVFSDEAYYDYIEEPNYPSMIELVKQGENVIVSRTFSKVYGLAGIRIGYLIAREDIIARLNENVVARPNVLAVFAAIEALKDDAFYKESLQKNRAAKAIIYETLDELNLTYQPSHGNFVFFKTGRDIDGFNQAMRQHGLWVGRPFPPLRDWCRVSTGRLEDMAVLAKGLRKEFG
jgi:histidinol-phosphate aminotransferase